MAKGRPPISPRIDAQDTRIAALEARIAEMEKREAIAAESMRTARLADVPRETYKPLYEQWPGNGS